MAPAFSWQADFFVGDAEMDETHVEFVDCVNALLTADDDALSQALERLADHARRHFSLEDQAMRRSVYDNAKCHVDEHAAVLRSVDEVRAALVEGRVSVVRAFAQALADWFPEHARVMDQGLAGWLAKCRLGGSPVRIQRRPVAQA
jgi:hemerythrin